MSFNQFLSILFARKFIFIFTLLITVGSTVAISLVLPKQYEASTSIIFNSKGVDPISGNNLPVSMMPGYIATQVEVLNSQKVALKVVEKLSLFTNPVFVESYTKSKNANADIRIWLSDLLLSNLDVSPSREASIVTISYTSSSPEFSAVVANAFAEEYINTNIELKVEPARKAAQWFDVQVKSLKADVAEAQQKLTEYEKEKGILSSDSRFDVETARLNQLTTAQLQSEEQLFDLKTKIDAVKTGEIKQADTELLNSSVINSLKVKLSQAEANFAELRQRLSRNHPDYKSASAELSSLRWRFKKEVDNVQAQLQESAKREEKRLIELTEKVDLQKQKLLALNADLDKQEVLSRDVDVAKQVLSAAMERMSKITLEGQVDQADVSVLNQATPPSKHAKPNLIINTILSVFLGTILAIAFSILFELMNRKVRSKSDIEAALNIPVLSEISKFKPLKN